MDNIIKIFIDYWFESFDEVIETLEHGERKEGDNIFFENAISTIREIFDYLTYQHKLLKSDKKTIGDLMEQVEKLQMRIDILNHKLFILNQQLKWL